MNKIFLYSAISLGIPIALIELNDQLSNYAVRYILIWLCSDSDLGKILFRSAAISSIEYIHRWLLRILITGLFLQKLKQERYFKNKLIQSIYFL
ncbi:hypothetical protein MASR2M78_15640 [Treponema sp.]